MCLYFIYHLREYVIPPHQYFSNMVNWISEEEKTMFVPYLNYLVGVIHLRCVSDINHYFLWNIFLYSIQLLDYAIPAPLHSPRWEVFWIFCDRAMSQKSKSLLINCIFQKMINCLSPNRPRVFLSPWLQYIFRKLLDFLIDGGSGSRGLSGQRAPTT